MTIDRLAPKHLRKLPLFLDLSAHVARRSSRRSFPPRTQPVPRVSDRQCRAGSDPSTRLSPPGSISRALRALSVSRCMSAVGDPVQIWNAPVVIWISAWSFLSAAGEQLDGFRVARPGSELDLDRARKRQLGQLVAAARACPVIGAGRTALELIDDHVDLAERRGEAGRSWARATRDRIAGVRAVQPSPSSQLSGVPATQAPIPDRTSRRRCRRSHRCSCGRRRRRTEACAVHALVADGAGVAVVAHARELDVQAAIDRVARVGRARIRVVAVERHPCRARARHRVAVLEASQTSARRAVSRRDRPSRPDALAADAAVARRCRRSVVAGCGVGGVHARRRPEVGGGVARVVGTDVAVVAVERRRHARSRRRVARARAVAEVAVARGHSPLPAVRSPLHVPAGADVGPGARVGVVAAVGRARRRSCTRASGRRRPPSRTGSVSASGLHTSGGTVWTQLFPVVGSHAMMPLQTLLSSHCRFAAALFSGAVQTPFWHASQCCPAGHGASAPPPAGTRILTGAEVAVVARRAVVDIRVDAEEIRPARAARARVVVVALMPVRLGPHSPVGRVAELEAVALVAVVARHRHARLRSCRGGRTRRRCRDRRRRSSRRRCTAA